MDAPHRGRPYGCSVLRQGGWMSSIHLGYVPTLGMWGFERCKKLFGEVSPPARGNQFWGRVESWARAAGAKVDGSTIVGRSVAASRVHGSRSWQHGGGWASIAPPARGPTTGRPIGYTIVSNCALTPASTPVSSLASIPVYHSTSTPLWQNARNRAKCKPPLARLHPQPIARAPARWHEACNGMWAFGATAARVV